VFHIILFEPEIPPNAGNVIRLCANTGATLHLVRPLGFTIDDSRVRRAGLDYHEMARVREHASLADCLAALDGARVFADETSGSQRYDEVRYQAGDAFLYGRETAGLPAETLAGWPRAAGPPADGSRQPQPQPVERGCGRRVRSLAPARLRWRPMRHTSAGKPPGTMTDARHP
jgi:tRNA (cytidine/uridine-2'-O-)-methyltransferase